MPSNKFEQMLSRTPALPWGQESLLGTFSTTRSCAAQAKAAAAHEERQQGAADLICGTSEQRGVCQQPPRRQALMRRDVFGLSRRQADVFSFISPAYKRNSSRSFGDGSSDSETVRARPVAIRPNGRLLREEGLVSAEQVLAVHMSTSEN